MDSSNNLDNEEANLCLSFVARNDDSDDELKITELDFSSLR